MALDRSVSLEALRAALAEISQDELERIQGLIDQLGGVEAARDLLENLDDDELAEAA